jgi:GntR family transcriptional repressor for pyruvate dehydrogenase complex
MEQTDRVSEIAYRFEQLILSGKLAPGDQLPSERDISIQMEVSRSVVREALGRLASFGLVRSTRGSGTKVERPNGRLITLGYKRLLHGADLHLLDLSAVRMPLETTIATLAAVKRTEAHLARMEQAQKVMSKPRRSLEDLIKADLYFHATLADATGNAVFNIILSPMQELLIESRRRTLGRFGSEPAYLGHAEILEAVRAREPKAAEEAMRRHIEANIQHLRADLTESGEYLPEP